MSLENSWRAIAARITPDAPTNLGNTPVDAALAETPAPRAPSSRLFPQRAEGQSYLGVRITAPPADAAGTAARLAAAALERRVVPILLSHLPQSGFERFGFRVERILGETAEQRAAQEAELQRFWDLAIIIDLTDVAGMR